MLSPRAVQLPIFFSVVCQINNLALETLIQLCRIYKRVSKDLFYILEEGVKSIFFAI